VHYVDEGSGQTLLLLHGNPTCLILDAAPTDSVATIGFSSADCDADFTVMVKRGAVVLEPPQHRPYGARVAYFKGPGALKIELEQLLHTIS
jgi:uncharacterized glyoxalase superfamily protein PhnB